MTETPPITVLLVDDEEEVRRSFEQSLLLQGFEAQTFARAERALERLTPKFLGVVVSDIRMPQMDGMAFLKAAREIDPEIPVILVTGHGDVPLAVEAMQAGAYDFLEKPLDPQRLCDCVARAGALRRLTIENRAMRAELTERSPLDGEIVGQSPAMIALRQKVQAIGPTAIDALILGETGTGKDLIARALHELSERRDKPFVAINLALLPSATIESELFGHEMGAFPGAMRRRFGKFENANGGTVLLDEIGAAPPALQTKLLRVIEDRAIERLGSNERIELDLRFIATSNQDLDAMARDGSFRSDLLYRLAVVAIEAPPLRDRLEDVPRLFHHLVRLAARRLGRSPPPIPAARLAALSQRKWPGNVREMRNLAERFVLGLDDADQDSATAAGDAQETLAAQMERFEKGALTAALTRHGGNLKLTYEALGLSRKTLYEKMQKHGLRRQDFGERADSSEE